MPLSSSVLILSGGVIEGLPELAELIEQGMNQRALEATGKALQVLRPQMHSGAGVVGAAAMMMRLFAKEEGGRCCRMRSWTNCA